MADFPERSNRRWGWNRAIPLRRDDDVGLPLIFSLRISCVCTADGAGSGCGAHGSCVNGLCKCDEGYCGGMCETIIDHCKFPAEVNCGAHGSCIDGSCVCESAAYSGNRCQDFDACYGVHCGAHGDCVNGSCVCKVESTTCPWPGSTCRWTGSTCNQAPLRCCSSSSCLRSSCSSCRSTCGACCSSSCGRCSCDGGC